MAEAHEEYSLLFDSDVSAVHTGITWGVVKIPTPSPFPRPDSLAERQAAWISGCKPAGWLRHATWELWLAVSTPVLAGLCLWVGIASEDTQSRWSADPADTCQVFSMGLHSLNHLMWTVSLNLTVRDVLSISPVGVMSRAYGLAANCKSGWVLAEIYWLKSTEEKLNSWNE